jgi:Aromatic-ring-opening dioxygenase LigAB, LigA subunit
MSLYYLQKLLYQLNRDVTVRARYGSDREALLREYTLTAEELGAVRGGDVGLLYVMGVNGQLLMHYAALLGMPWDAYMEAMREGVRRHGPVRAGIYTLASEVAK